MKFRRIYLRMNESSGTPQNKTDVEFCSRVSGLFFVSVGLRRLLGILWIQRIDTQQCTPFELSQFIGSHEVRTSGRDGIEALNSDYSVSFREVL